MKKIKINFCLFIFLSFSLMTKAQEAVKATWLDLDKDYEVVIGETIMNDGSRTQPSKPNSIRFEKHVEGNQEYVKTIFEDEKFAHTLLLKLTRVEDGENYKEYYTFQGSNDETRVAILTYYPDVMSVAGKDVDLNLELVGYWGKMKYNLFFNTQSDEKSKAISQKNTPTNSTIKNTTSNTEKDKVVFNSTDKTKGNLSTELVDHTKLILKDDGKVIAFVDLTFSNFKMDGKARIFNYVAKGLGFNKLTILDLRELSIPERRAFMNDEESPAVVYLSGEGGKFMYVSSMISGKLLPPNNGETEKSTATIHQEFTAAFKALENGFKNEMTKVISEEETLTTYKTGLEIGSFGNEYLLKRKIKNAPKATYHIASIKGNQIHEKQILDALKNYAHPTYKIVALPSASNKKHFAIEREQRVIGFLEFGKDNLLSTGLISFVLREAVDDNQFKLSIEKGYKTLKNNPDLLKRKFIGETDGMKKYQVEDHLFGAMASYITITEKENSTSWTNGLLNCSFEGVMYLLKGLDFNLKGTKEVGTFDEKFQPTEDINKIKLFKISFSAENERYSIILGSDGEGRVLIELGFMDQL